MQNDRRERPQRITRIDNVIQNEWLALTAQGLAKKLYISRGAVERRVKYLLSMGLVTGDLRCGLFLKDEMYLPPPWLVSTGAEEDIFKLMPEKNQRNHKGARPWNSN